MSELFDEAEFEAFKADLGDEDALEALEAFLADTADKIARLQATNEDRPLVKLEAHSIKSSAALFGFAELSSLARALEPNAATLEAEKLRQAIDELGRSFEATLAFARTRLLARVGQG
jgi:histidine phosphotransfer protein HptB